MIIDKPALLVGLLTTNPNRMVTIKRTRRSISAAIALCLSVSFFLM